MCQAGMGIACYSAAGTDDHQFDRHRVADVERVPRRASVTSHGGAAPVG